MKNIKKIPGKSKETPGEYRERIVKQIEDKHQAFIKICRDNGLKPEKIEIGKENREMVFEFSIPEGRECDQILIQRNLCGIFDFAGSISVIINHTGLAAQKAVQEESKRQSLPKKSEQVQNTQQSQKSFPQKEKQSFGKKVKTPVGNAYYGKPSHETVMPLSEIDYSHSQEMEDRPFCGAGRVFNINSRACRNEGEIFTFNLTDETGSVGVKLFDKAYNLTTLHEKLKKNSWVKVSGKLSMDNYQHQLLLVPRNIEPEEAPKREDNAKVKRVELHLHTQYSAMDAVSKVDKIMARAVDFGHDVIGVTDHGVVQAYPEMMNLSRKTGIKVLYGVEGYLVDDGQKIVSGHQNEPFDGEFVFFDLETTGLVAGKDRIIEIGAVKIRHQQIIESFSTFVDPQRPIPQKITALTGISDEMVAGAPDEKTALERFAQFCKREDGSWRILAAHNAHFDMGFLRVALKRQGISEQLTGLDTLAMSRTFLKQLGSHKLKKLAGYFKIDMGHHHRAQEDASCSAKVLLKLMAMAEKEGCTDTSGLNALMDHSQVIKTSRPYHVVIFAKNQAGIKDLYKIVSKAHVDYFYKRPRIPKSLLQANRQNLLIGSACEAGELYTAVKTNASQSTIDELCDFYDYFEVQPLGNNRYMVREGELSEEDLVKINQRIVELGKEKGKPVVATGDVHFVDPSDALYREVLQAGQGYEDAPFQAPLYYRSTEEMLAEFDYLDPETAYEIVVTNTRKIADSIERVLPIPDGTFPPVIEGSDDEIRKMVYEKAHEIYGEDLPEIVAARVKKELDSIINNGYSVLYLIAQKLVHHSLEDGYLVGSRGSVGSSLVAMLSGITEVNSLPPHYICPNCKHCEFFESTVVGTGPDLPDANCPKCGTKLMKDGFDIPFETFLGFKGDKEPDIDLNFSGENQGEAHHYTEVLFGKGKVYRAGTIATMADKTAYGFVKKFYEAKGEVQPEAEMERVIEGCTGVKRTTGQHPGGVMVVPKDKEIYDFTPVQYPADDRESGTLTTHFDYHSIQGRLLKLDILGHDDPTMLRMLKDLTGLDPQTIPLDDQKVLSLFKGTESLNLVEDDFDISLGTCGVPEFGTAFVRQMVLDAKPAKFADLVRISGLSHGTDVWLNNAQTLILNKVVEIKDVISTRDDIMLGLIAMGLDSEKSFKIMENVRKGKGLTEEEETTMRSSNVPDWFIDSCKKIKYMFPKAHAVAYVMMAFRIAYYKVYYPLAYYATYFSIRAKEFNLVDMTSGKAHIKKRIEEIKALGNQASNKESNSLVSLEIGLEMYCRGFSFAGVDLYRSHYKNFLIEENQLIPPLMVIDGLGEKAAQPIYEEAKKSPFLSREDLAVRAHVNKSNLDQLAALGCLGGLPETNQLSFFNF